ncbi:glycosyltransferase [Poseidonocella sedimentorum]|uniref:UDP:flavonoid glycosyltransferase YjiC, YdhE family n=1 Tax=Poseidonocella sedimentorum TaxID=871652 RepID=A0A1I6DL20_9RHOB|nr:glycosyltransferase [Poseidonocella sedimentorum]SFR06155.1 UDP:flavonoid glycosyltransferase YjiC, YdhE family [Poseidonocella sedimentorum]
MHITVLALGSRGDVQPLLALSLGLKARGFAVRFAAPRDFQDWVEGHGLDFFPLTGRAASFFGGAAGAAMRDRLRDEQAFQRFFQDYLGTFLDKLFVACTKACAGTDAILCWSWTRAGPSLAEAFGVPLFVVGATPALHLPTSVFANPFQDRRTLVGGPVHNRLSWRKALPFTRIGQPQVDRWRKQSLGLAPLDWRTELRRLRRAPHLFGFSPSVLPKPWDWGRHVHVTGYWFLEDTAIYTPPPDLEAFLNEGDPPVAIGFSSQVGGDARKVTRAVVAGLRASGRRGILISGWGGLKGVELTDDMFVIDKVPYGWLLPRVAGMVHQGGAGSVAMALQSGTPSVAVAFGYDQRLWGERIAHLRAGPAPLAAATLTAEQVARAIDAVATDPELKRGALRAADRIAREDGVGTACGSLETALGQPARGATRRSAKPDQRATEDLGLALASGNRQAEDRA